MPESIIPTFEMTVVKRHLTHKKVRTALSIMAVAVAVTASIVLVSIQNGFQDFLFDIIFRNLPHVVVSPLEGEDYLHLYRNIAERAWELQGVIAVSPTLATTATFAYKDNVENAGMIGVDPVEADKISVLSEDMIEGEFGSVQGGYRIIVGSALAEKLDIQEGDTVQVSFPEAENLSLVVSGIFETGFQPVDEGTTFVSLETAREFVGEGDVVTGVDIKLDDPYRAEAVAENLSSYGYNAEGWQELYPDIVRTLAFERAQNFVTLLLLMVIATFGVAGSMSMLVLQKTREIGMLMAIGATPGNIRRLFIIESAALGLMGAAVGSFFGFLISLYLRGIQIPSPTGETIDLPILLDPMDFVTFGLLSVGLGILAGAYPAYRASKLDPVEALRS